MAAIDKHRPVGIMVGVRIAERFLGTEIQHDTSSGFPSPTSVFAKAWDVDGKIQLIIPFPRDDITRFFRARHFRAGESSLFTNTVSAKPKELGETERFQTRHDLTQLVQQDDGVVLRVIAKGHLVVIGRDTNTVVFTTNFQNPPIVIARFGGISHEPRSAQWSPSLNTALPMYRDGPLGDMIDVSGFDIRAKLRQKGAITARTEDFPAGNSLTTVGSTTEANLANAPANDFSYKINYKWKMNRVDDGKSATGTLTVAFDANDGAGWIERASTVYNWTPAEDDTFNQDTKTIVDSALGLNDDVRIRIKSFSGTNVTFEVHGNNVLVDADPSNGVTYNTSSDAFANQTPDADDSVTFDVLEVT